MYVLFFDVMLPFLIKLCRFLLWCQCKAWVWSKKRWKAFWDPLASEAIPFLGSSYLPSSHQGHIYQDSEGLPSMVLV